MKPIELAEKEYKDGTLHVKTFSDDNDKQYLFRMDGDIFFTGEFFDPVFPGNEPEDGDLYIIEFGRDGYKWELNGVTHYILIDELLKKEIEP